MLQRITSTTQPREHIGSVTRKGQFTLPAEVRKHLNLGKDRKLAVVMNPDGSAQLRVPKYPTLESIAGAVKPLAKPMTIHEMREVIADELAAKHQAKNK